MPVLTGTINGEKLRAILTCRVQSQSVWNLLSTRALPAQILALAVVVLRNSLFLISLPPPRVSWPARSFIGSHSLSKLKSTLWQVRKQSPVPSVKGPSARYVSSAQRGLTGGCEEHSERRERCGSKLTGMFYWSSTGWEKAREHKTE